MPQLAFVALAILGYALTAVRLDRLSISGPVVLVTVGALLGPAGVGAVSAPATSEPIRVLAYMLPVTHGIQLMQDIMLRGSVTQRWEFAALGAIALVTLFVAWRGLRRGMSRA